MLYLQQVHRHANSRLTVQSGKSQVSDPENPGSRKNQAQPEVPKQKKLRETRGSAEESWAKLDVTSQSFFFKAKPNLQSAQFIYHFSEP
jgi:hypothetical protein